MSEIVQVKPRFQITIPKDVRDVLAIQEGEYLSIEIKGKSLVLKPLKPGRIVGKAHSPTSLRELAGRVSIGGNAIEDTKKLYE
jgi:AbrB family looped-hinge helix DNA binding protein